MDAPNRDGRPLAAAQRREEPSMSVKAPDAPKREATRYWSTRHMPATLVDEYRVFGVLYRKNIPLERVIIEGLRAGLRSLKADAAAAKKQAKGA